MTRENLMDDLVDVATLLLPGVVWIALCGMLWMAVLNG
jgi:hypothetical protein